MLVGTLSRWSGDDKTIVANAKKAKALIEKPGGTVRLSRIHTGLHAGQFMAAVRYPDWESSGKAQVALAAEPVFQKIMADALTATPRHDSAIVVGIDI
jgi:hypothetical protein